MARLRIGRHECVHIAHVKDVAVIRHEKRRALERLAIELLPRCAFVKVGTHTRVHNELGQRAAAIQVQDILVLRIALKTHARLNRNAQSRPAANILQKELELAQVAQKAGALSFAHNRTRGTAQVEIDLAVAHIGQNLGCPHKLVGIFAHQLRNNSKPLIVRRVKLLEGFSSKGLAHTRRR